MIAAERMGAHHAQLLKYANSGDVTGDKSRVVGYGALALVADNRRRTRSTGARARSSPSPPPKKQELLKIARHVCGNGGARKEALPCPPISRKPSAMPAALS